MPRHLATEVGRHMELFLVDGNFFDANSIIASSVCAVGNVKFVSDLRRAGGHSQRCYGIVLVSRGQDVKQDRRA